MGSLNSRLEEIKKKLNLKVKREKIAQIEKESSDPKFWEDHFAAGKKMQELTSLQREVEEVEELEKAIAEGKDGKVKDKLGVLELKTYLSGANDREGAVFSIHAGQGGTEAMDWSEMLERMYRRFFEKMSWQYKEADKTYGEEAGIKSVTLTVDGSYAYGYLKGETGVHRLVRQSPFNADKLRQTSFAGVEVMPLLKDEKEVEIKDSDLEWDFFRSSGHGGQNVNKVSTAVRLRHLKTGIVVTCRQERHQAQNRENALKILRAKLWARQQAEREKKQKILKGEYKVPSWGNQIRSYVLHPYHLVKDLRTGYETSDTDRVLDGEIKDFIYSYLTKI